MKQYIFIFTTCLALLLFPIPTVVEGAEQADACYDLPGIHNGDFVTYDKQPNIFVNGDFHVYENGKELEGVVVVGQDFHVPGNGHSAEDKNGLNIGVVGVGSQISPPPGSDTLIVGDKITTSRYLDINNPSAKAETYGGNVLAGNKIEDQALVETNGGTVNASVESPLASYKHYFDEMKQLSQTYANRSANGDILVEGNDIVLEGDGKKKTYIFNWDDSVVTDNHQAYSIMYRNMPLDAEVIINVMQEDFNLNVASFIDENRGVINTSEGILSTKEFVYRTTHTLWNFVETSDLTLNGATQFFGSIIAPKESLQAEMNIHLNGRTYIGGDLAYGQTGQGLEVHNYPYLPNCNDPDAPDLPETEKPEEPEIPELPEEPNQPGESEKPDKPNQPEVPGESDNEEPEEPVKPVEPEDPKEPSQPERPEDPENPEGSEKPEKPGKPEGPGESNKPEESEKPEEPNQPGESEKPDKPNQPEVPGESDNEEPENPGEPVEPEDPKEPVQPEGPNCSDDREEESPEKPEESDDIEDPEEPNGSNDGESEETEEPENSEENDEIDDPKRPIDSDFPSQEDDQNEDLDTPEKDSPKNSDNQTDHPKKEAEQLDTKEKLEQELPEETNTNQLKDSKAQAEGEVEGKTLPKTATIHYNLLLIGFLLILSGGLFLFRQKAK